MQSSTQRIIMSIIAASLVVAFVFWVRDVFTGAIILGSTIDLVFFQIRWYGLLQAVAILLGVLLTRRLLILNRLPNDWADQLLVWLVPAGYVGARLYYVVFSWEYFRMQPWSILALWEGGLAIHGALLGGFLGLLAFAQRKKVPLLQLTDLIAPAVTFGQILGRWGNFFNYEAFGGPTSLPWKMYVPEGMRPLSLMDAAFFHPTFLYEAFWNLPLLVVLLWMHRQVGHEKVGRAGMATALYIGWYSLGRLWIEALRIDSLYVGDMRVAQLVSGMGILISFAMFWYIKNRPKSVSSSS